MRTSYGEADFAAAVARVAEAPPRTLADQLGVDWDYLGWVALGVSQQVVDEPALVEPGGEAFTAGFLVGAFLCERAARAGEALPHAVDAVRERGRHAVIADFCDLSAVASFETTYAEALLEALETPTPVRERAGGQLTRLFEAGLATGLLLEPV